MNFVTVDLSLSADESSVCVGDSNSFIFMEDVSYEFVGGGMAANGL